MGLRCGDKPEDILPAAEGQQPATEGQRTQIEQELDAAKVKQRETMLAFGEEVFQAAQDDADLANRFGDRYAAVLQACSETKELQCRWDTIEDKTHDGIDAPDNVSTTEGNGRKIAESQLEAEAKSQSKADEGSQSTADIEQATGLRLEVDAKPAFDLQPTVVFVPVSAEQPTVAFVPVPGDQPTAVLQSVLDDIQSGQESTVEPFTAVPADSDASASVEAVIRICPACDAPAEVGDRYCMMCGALLPNAQSNAAAQADPTGRICPACGAGYEQGDHFCMMCGQKLLGDDGLSL